VEHTTIFKGRMGLYAGRAYLAFDSEANAVIGKPHHVRFDLLNANGGCIRLRPLAIRNSWTTKPGESIYKLRWVERSGLYVLEFTGVLQAFRDLRGEPNLEFGLSPCEMIYWPASDTWRIKVPVLEARKPVKVIDIRRAREDDDEGWLFGKEG